MLEDINKEPILSTFYKEELQKVKHTDVYLVEKIILVKFLGYAILIIRGYRNKI